MGKYVLVYVCPLRDNSEVGRFGYMLEGDFAMLAISVRVVDYTLIRKKGEL